MLILLRGQPAWLELDLKTKSLSKLKAKRAGSTSTPRRSPSPKRDYPRGTCTVTRPSQASPRKAEHTVTPAQDLEAFKADMTSMLSDMLQTSFQKFASQFNTNSGGQGNNSNEDSVPKEKFSEATVDVPYDVDNDNSPQRVQRTSPKGRTLQSLYLNVLEGSSNFHS